MTNTLTPEKRRERMEALWVEREWRKCLHDEDYFIRNYVWLPLIDDPDGRTRTKFDLYDYQENALNKMQTRRYLVLVKARQMGLTSLAMAHALWKIVFRPGQNIGLVSRSQDSANKNLGMAKNMYNFLPAWMKARGPRLDGDAAKQMRFVFPDGTESLLKSAPATRTVFAGETFTLVIADEVGLWDEDKANLSDDAMRSLDPTTLRGGSLFLISTARGAANYFARTYRDAKRGASKYLPIFEPWMKNPLMQCITGPDCVCDEPVPGRPCPTSYAMKVQENKDKPWLMYSEFPSNDEEAFRQSGATFFTGLPTFDQVAEDWQYAQQGRLEYDETGKPVFIQDRDPSDEGPIHLLYTPRELVGRHFVIGADPSLGKDNDASVAQILSFDQSGHPEIVGYFHDRLTAPTDFADELIKLGYYFTGPDGRPALLAPETNEAGGGGQVINRLFEADYPNLYYFTAPATRNRTPVRRAGFAMVPKLRETILLQLATYLRLDDKGERPLVGIYPLLRDELGTFVRREYSTAGGKAASRYQADTNCHDDTVTSLAIALWVAVEWGLMPTAPKSVIKQEDDVKFVPVITLDPIKRDLAKSSAQSRLQNIKWEQSLRRRSRRRK